MKLNAAAISRLAESHTPSMVRFLQDMISIPSQSGKERPVVERVRAEMRALDFDQVDVDPMGNVLGRVGDGKTVIVLDAHLDTVGVGDPGTWSVDPYAGEVRDGIIFGRGAADQEGGLAAAVYGAHMMRQAGLGGDFQLWVTGTVMEEDCDGLCWQYILQEQALKPDVVVITEPTGLAVHRGQRGRMEMEVRVQGRSSHGSAPERGDNAIYKIAPIISEIERLNETLVAGADPFLGKGSITISQVRSTAPSLCAVADSATIYLDRRLTRGETLEAAVAEIEALPSVRRVRATVSVPDYEEASYTGLRYPTKKFYPSWVMDESHPAVSAVVSTVEQVLDERPQVGKWLFSTNGVATCGMFGVPTVGFGPGDEAQAHVPDEHCPVEHLTKAACVYAAFGRVFSATGPSGGPR